jgi:hypothetical protein
MSYISTALGPQGPQGADGADGATGPQGGFGGPTGPTGSTGVQGAPGAPGVQGPQGAFGGPTGPQGFQGAQGNVGPTGGVGPQGPTGVTGSTGSQGSQGNVGAAGGMGFQGPTGTTGSQGFQGSTGSQGPQGVVGGVGVQGPTGPQGVQGSQGSLTGPAGGGLTGNYPDPVVRYISNQPMTGFFTINGNPRALNNAMVWSSDPDFGGPNTWNSQPVVNSIAAGPGITISAATGPVTIGSITGSSSFQWGPSGDVALTAGVSNSDALNAVGMGGLMPAGTWLTFIYAAIEDLGGVAGTVEVGLSISDTVFSPPPGQSTSGFARFLAENRELQVIGTNIFVVTAPTHIYAVVSPSMSCTLQRANANFISGIMGVRLA